MFHQGPYNALLNFWQQQGSTVDIKDWMNYDPYLGRIAGQHRDPEPNQGENPTP